ncbi:unnamed protein product, partial [Sphacelaria rigidula]
GRGSPSGTVVSSEALWGTALPITRPTSLSFCPDDCATLALACWDGQIIILQPTTTAAAAPGGRGADDTKSLRTNSTPLSILRTPTASTGKSPVPGGSSKSRRWKLMWRNKDKNISKKSGAHLEDQDGAFVCWCGENGRESGGASSQVQQAASLAISTYVVTGGDTATHDRERTASINSFSTPLGSKATVGFDSALTSSQTP